MIIGIYIFLNRGRKFIFRKELEKINDETTDIINKAIVKIVNQFEDYDQGVYRTEIKIFKILFAVYGDVLSIVLIKEELDPEEELTPELINSSDYLFSSIIFNQPLLTRLIEKEAGIENFEFFSQKLPKVKQKELLKDKFNTNYSKGEKNQKYFKKLDSIFDEVQTKLSTGFKEQEISEVKNILTIQEVFSNFIELTFRYARIYIMENLIRDLINDHSSNNITDIKMGVNDILFYFRKSINVLRDRTEIKYFLKIMDGHRIGIKIKNRIAFTILFLEEVIEINNGINSKYPSITFDSVDLVIDLILGKLDILKIALSKEVKATQLHKFVEMAAPLTAVLIKIYEHQEISKTMTLKRLTLEGLGKLIEALFIVNLKNFPIKLSLINGIRKIISLQIVNIGILTLVIDGNKMNLIEKIQVNIGPNYNDSDIILQGTLEYICKYANGEINFITALQNIKLIKGISMNPIDLIKGKTFRQISDLFSLWRLSQI